MADTVVGNVLNLTSCMPFPKIATVRSPDARCLLALRRDNTEVQPEPRQLESVTGVLAPVTGLLGGSVSPGSSTPAASSSGSSTPPAAGSSSPLEPVSGLLRRQGELTSLDTALAAIEALAGGLCSTAPRLPGPMLICPMLSCSSRGGREGIGRHR